MIDLLNCGGERPFRPARGMQNRHPLRTLIKQKNDIQTRLRELPLDKLEKLGEMLAELTSAENIIASTDAASNDL